jgi:hypothetical protein
MISGIGTTLRDRLIRAGFETAADINSGVYRVPDIGDKRGKELLAWRRSVEQEAKATEPKALPADELATIRARFQQQKQQLQEQREIALLHLKNSEGTIRQKYRQESDNLDRREAAIKADYQQEETRIRDQQASRRVQLEGDLARLVQEQKSSQLLAEQNRKITELRQRQASLSWEKARVSKQLDIMAPRVAFSDYVRRIFFLQ